MATEFLSNDDVLNLIGLTEKTLRSFISDRCQMEWGPYWQEKLCSRFPAISDNWKILQENDQNTIIKYALQPNSILDYSTLGDIKQIILTDWHLFYNIFLLTKTGGKDNKKTLSNFLDDIIEVRNRLAHQRLTHQHQIRKAWVACDELRMQIAAWRDEPMGETIQTNIFSNANTKILDPITRTSPTIKHFISLYSFLTRTTPGFPRLNDYETDLVYYPDFHAGKAEEMLKNVGLCLIVGRSAAGKTVMAVSLGKHFQETEDYDVYYGDAVRSQEGDGRAWYQEICANSNHPSLYILDNCHLAIREVNEFCFQLYAQHPPRVKVVLVSRPKVEESYREQEEIENYYDVLAEFTIRINPEEIYRGIIEKYAASFIKRDPSKYVPLDQDDYATLKQHHSHNLIGSKKRLDLWGNIGGKLSDITDDAVYEELANRYLGVARDSLLTLCALWQFEIRAHNIFIEQKLSRADIQELEESNLIQGEFDQNYGVLYRLLFHADEARAIFEAGIYRRWGRVDESMVDTEVDQVFRSYLLTSPPNYLEVFDGLFLHGKSYIEQQLMLDAEFQNLAWARFEHGRISDTAKYIFNLSKLSPARAKALLNEFILKAGMDNLIDALFSYSLHDFQFSLHYIQRTDPLIAEQLFSRMDLYQIALIAEIEDLYNLSWLIRTLSRISKEHTINLVYIISFERLAQKATKSDFVSLNRFLIYLQNLGFKNNDLEYFLSLADLAQIANRVESQSYLSFQTITQTFNDISTKQAINFLEAICVKSLVTQELTNVYYFTLLQALVFLKKWEYPSEKLESFLIRLDINFFAEKVRKSGGFWKATAMILLFRQLDPAMAEVLLSIWTPAGLAEICNARPLTLKGVSDLTHHIYGKFRSDFIQEFTKEEILGLIETASLRDIGRFFRVHLVNYPGLYEYFKNISFPYKLTSTTMRELATFINQVGKVRAQGKLMVGEVLDYILNNNLWVGVLQNHFVNIQKYLVEVENLINIICKIDQNHPAVDALQSEYKFQLVYFLTTPLSKIDDELKNKIYHDIKSKRTIEKIIEFELDQLTTLIRNVAKYIDLSLGKQYCGFIDTHLELERLEHTDSITLLDFVCELALTGDKAKLCTCDNVIVLEHIETSLRSELLVGEKLLAIVRLTQPEVEKWLQMPDLETHPQKMELCCWLSSERNWSKPMDLVLVIQGMRAHNPEIGKQILLEHLPLWEATGILASAVDRAVSSTEIELIQGARDWLADLFNEYVGQTLAELSRLADRLERK